MATATTTQTLGTLSQTASATYTGRIATVDQTLAPVTQLGTATFAPGAVVATVNTTISPIVQHVQGWYCFQLIDTVIVKGIPAGSNIELYEDSPVLVGESIYSIQGSELTAIVQVTDEQSYFISESLIDTVLAGEQLNTDWTTSLNDSIVRVTDSQVAIRIINESSTVQVSDSMTSIHTNVLSSTVNVSDEITPQNLANSLLSSEVQADGYIYSGATLEHIFDTVQISDTQVTIRSTTSDYADTVTAREVLTETRTTFEELLDAVNVDDLITFDGSVYNNELIDTVNVIGIPWAADFNAIAWVMNTETTGLSNYTNFDFTSIASHDGVVYVTSNNGVYALTNDTDDGRYIAAEVQTGFLDLGREETKRISDVYVGYTGGQLELDVETYDGPQDVYTYTMEERAADAPRNNRIKTGKGLSSRYWRFSFRNLDGADFQVYDTSAVVGVSKRRL